MDMTYDEMLREMEAYYAATAAAAAPAAKTLTRHEEMLERLCAKNPEERDDALLSVLRKAFSAEEAEVWLQCPAVGAGKAPLALDALRRQVRPELRWRLRDMVGKLLERKVLLHAKTPAGQGYFARCDAHCINTLRALAQPKGRAAAGGSLVKVEPGMCVGCKACVKVCPVDAILLQGKIVVIDGALCMGCGACVRKCPKKALRM